MDKTRDGYKLVVKNTGSSDFPSFYWKDINMCQTFND